MRDPKLLAVTVARKICKEALVFPYICLCPILMTDNLSFCRESFNFSHCARDTKIQKNHNYYVLGTIKYLKPPVSQ